MGNLHVRRWSPCVWLMLAATLCAPVLSPEAAEPGVVESSEPERPDLNRNSRDFRDLAQHALGTEKITFGLQIDFLTTYEKQGPVERDEFIMDGLELALEANPLDGLQAFISLTYEDVDHSEEQVDVDEAFIRLGVTDDFPYFIEGGRMDVPFGEFNSAFIEDPSVVPLGETVEDVITVGVEGDLMELSLSAFSGETGPSRTFDEWVVTLITEPFEDLEIGTFWTTDIGEAEEMRELIKEARSDDDDEEDDEPTPRAHDVMGWGAFLLLETERFMLDVEYITAVESYRPGVLGDTRLRPSAWYAEMGCWLVGPWLAALRIEQSDELPDSPKWQHGVATSYGLTEHVILSAEYLRGDFDDEPDRDLALFQVSIAY